MALFCIFCWQKQKISQYFGTQFKCSWKIFFSKHDLDKWAHFYVLLELYPGLILGKKGKKKFKKGKKGQNI